MTAPTWISFLPTPSPGVVIGTGHPLDLGPLVPPSIGAYSFSPFNPVKPMCVSEGQWASARRPGRGLTSHIFCFLRLSVAVRPSLRWMASLPCPSSFWPALSIFLLSTRAVTPASTSRLGVHRPPVLPCARCSAGPAVLPGHLSLSPAVSKLDSAEGPSTALRSPEQARSL